MRFRRRIRRIRAERKPNSRSSRRLTAVECSISVQSFVSVLVVAFLCAGMLEQMVLSEDGGALHEFIAVAMEEVSTLD